MTPVIRLAFLCYCVLFFGVFAAVSSSASVQEQKPADNPPPGEERMEITIKPLRKNETNWEDFKELSAEEIGESVIILRSGQIISLRDWVLGGLTKSNIDGTLTGLSQQQFLGAVASDLLLAEDPLNMGQPLPVGRFMPGIIQDFETLPLSTEAEIARFFICVIACYDFDETPGAFGAMEETYDIMPVAAAGGVEGVQFGRAMSRVFATSYRDWKRNQFLIKRAKKVGIDPALLGQ